jgi:hypothetical protein
VTAIAAILPLNTRLSCAEPLRLKDSVDMETSADLPTVAISWLPNRQMPTKRRSAMAFGIMAAVAMERDASLDMNKEVGKMLPAYLAWKLTALMSHNEREGLNL